jgi:putative FmdB family regulatory protein
MPIYEYKCRSCGSEFEQLIIHSTTPECPACQSRDLERTVSAFAVSSDTTRNHALSAGRKRGMAEVHDRRVAEREYVTKHVNEDH